MADSVDMINFVRLFFADCLHLDGIDLRRPDEILKLLPEACDITDCKSLYDALETERIIGARTIRKAIIDRCDSDTTTDAVDRD